MNVFLSHSTKDGDFVQRLATALEANGFTPWLCEVDIEKGANFVAKINEGLAQSDLALLLWSQHAANSAWTLEEWTAALARQVEENRIRLGIVLLRDCPMPLPPLLRPKNYVDARADEDAGIDGVLGWLKKRHQAQRLSGLRAPVYLPDYRPQDFVGRSAYLARLQETLTAEPGVFLLYGEPGAGKTMLALRFAWDAQKDFDAVIFQTCGQRPLDAITAELTERLPIDVKTMPPDKQRDAAKAWLRERQSLLVLDDVWSAEVRQLEPGPPCSVLHTARQHTLPGIAAKQSAEVEKFTEAEAEELFRTYLDPVFGEGEVTRNREALLSFGKRVEWLPIAVAVGASLLRERAAATLGQAVPKLKLETLRDGAKDVNALFRTAIASQPEHEQKLLAAGAICVQEGFWLPLAAEIAGLSEDDAEDAADRLVRSSLLRVIDRERRRFQLHALLREQVREEQGDEDIVKLQARHAAALERIFQAWNDAQDQPARWQACRECLEEVVPAAEFLEQRGESRRNTQLSYWGGELGRRIGELDLAFRIMKLEESFGAKRDDRQGKYARMASFGNQALILENWGRPQEALALLKEVEAIARDLGDKDSLQNVYGNAAVILKNLGRLEDALALLKAQQAICRELGNQNSLQISYGNQAGILYQWGRLEEAMELYQKQETLCLGNKDSLSKSYAGQGLILLQWGKLEEALAMHKKEEAICGKLGNKDGLQECYGHQAGILYLLGRVDEGMELYQRREALCLELGNKYGLSESYGGQAIVLGSRGQLDDAMALYKKEEALCRELGDKSGLARSYGNQANILANWERLGEAVALHKMEETIALELGDKSKLGTCYANWGLTARKQGDTKTAKEKLEQALAIFTELKMPRQRDAVQQELEKAGAGIRG